MKQLWDRVSNIGVGYAKDVSEKKIVVLINRMSCVLAWMMILFTILGIVQGLYDILYFSGTFVLLFLLPLYFQKQGWLKFTRYFFCFVPILSVLSICYYNGGGMGDKFFFIPTSLIPLIIFKHKGKIYFLFLISFAAFYLAWWYQEHYPPVKPIPAADALRYFVFSMSSVFAIIYFVVQYFRAGSEDYERELEVKNAEISEKNKDILDSIHYARRIQRALLASDALLKNNLGDLFVFYKPKDIVSGDYYWAHELPDGKFLLLTGDCTGHGVPGAFMSLLNTSIMHELTFAHHITRPDEILNAQRKAIIESLNPEGVEEKSKDGMDCVLCRFDLKNRKLDFACANNPLWIMRDGKMMEFEADKQPIGIHEGEEKNYTLHTVELKPGDIIYTFTDGFADQFGGARGKKYKYKSLIQKLSEISVLPMKQQRDDLEKEFDAWKGNLEQIDDVLIIGVRI